MAKLVVRSLGQILAEQRISPKRLTGNIRALCPHCSVSRRHGKKERDLTVKAYAKGVLWQCWHCGARGFEWFEQWSKEDDRKKGTGVVGAAPHKARNRRKVQYLYG